MPVSLFMQIFNTMKGFVIRIAVFFAMVVLADIVVGVSFDFLSHNAKSGLTKRDSYICDALETDFLLMGSSRCVRHYNPQIISDSLGVSCYNSGQMGNGIILNYGRLKMINERKRPKVVIYDVTPGFDIFIGEDNHRYLTWLKSHYDRDNIPAIFESIDKTEKFKMLSQMYRYNSKVFEIITDFLRSTGDDGNNGFLPLAGDFDRNKIREDDGNSILPPVDPLKVKYINNLIDESEGSKLYFVVSPIWYGMDTLQFEPVKQICIEHGVPFIDFSNNPKYVHQDIFFKDGSHLNAKGADEFTRDLLRYL